jgi:hypothetical protein
MYPCYLEAIAPERRETFSASWIVLENLLHVSTWVVAGMLLWPLRWFGWPMATVAWAVLVIAVQVLLKKHNCSGCYYYGKRCHLGWGVLSAHMFHQDSGSPGTGVRLSLFYVVGPPVILVASILGGVLQHAWAGHWFLLGAYVALNAVVLAVRVKGCRLCAMRRSCPGSAAKDR